MHFWIGSFCGVLDNNYYNNNDRPRYPRGVIAICDVMRLIEDIGNQIPNKSWMLYLLEIFNKQNIPSELNLICQFDNQDYFEAIFAGVNQYRFKQVLSIVGHSYVRQIVMNSLKRTVSYILEDQDTKQTERFDLHLKNIEEFVFEGQNQFTGIEWWNKIGNFPYPLRYIVEISQLLFGLADHIDSESITYLPHNALIPNNDGSGTKYPISFQNIRINDECICYTVQPGNCHTGIRYNC